MKTMTNKLDDYKQNQDLTDEQIIRAAAEEKRDLSSGEDTVVATGDEETPVSSADPADARKALYAKARKNRELVQRDDAEGTPDVALLQRLHAEASGGKTPTTEIDTNKPDRFAADRGEENEEQYAARLIAEDQQRNEEAGEKLPASASDTLTLPEVDATVEVTILGRVMTVPQQDIDDAGGLNAYQKNRAATIKLQRAATLETKAQQTLNEIEEKQHGVQTDADPSLDGQSEADIDIDSLHEEMMDVVVDGTAEDQKKWMQDKLQSARSRKAPETPAPTRSLEVKTVRSESQEELDRQFEADRVDANTMMKDDFPELMSDPELLGLAQQRFNVIKTNPNNEGRSQLEMARESANFVKGIGRRMDAPRRPDPVETERQQRVERKRQLPQQSRADRQAPSQVTQEAHIPTRKEHFERLRKASGNA